MAMYTHRKFISSMHEQMRLPATHMFADIAQHHAQAVCASHMRPDLNADTGTFVDMSTVQMSLAYKFFANGHKGFEHHIAMLPLPKTSTDSQKVTTII